MSEQRDVLVPVSCPGGMAPEYRVQVQGGQSPRWQHAASYATLRQARECAARLLEGGHTARIIACRALPTAA